MEFINLFCFVYTCLTLPLLVMFCGFVWWATYENEKHRKEVQEKMDRLYK